MSVTNLNPESPEAEIERRRDRFSWTDDDVGYLIVEPAPVAKTDPAAPPVTPAK